MVMQLPGDTLAGGVNVWFYPPATACGLALTISSSLLAGAPGRGLDDGDSCDDSEIYYFNVLTTLE